MKVLLIRPKPSPETIGLQHVMVCEPLELEYLISNVPEQIKDQVSLKIYDFILEKRSFDEILSMERPDFVVFTGYITHVETIKGLAKKVKTWSKSALTGVGGVHAEVVGDDYLDPAIDFIYRKNSIVGFNASLEGLLEGLQPQQIACRIRDVESGPYQYPMNHPDRSSISQYRNQYYYMFHNPCALIKTSYGCPYKCSFCFCKEITNGAYSSRDIADVVSELSTIDEKEIYIVDDDFLFDPRRLENFIDLLKSKNIRKNYLVYGRADFIANHEALMEKLRNAGLRAVIVGIESMRKTDLESYNKKTTVEMNEKCIAVLRALDIELYATLILPMDFTTKDFKDMTKWLVSQKVTFVNLQPLTPMPGTEIFDVYKSQLLVERSRYEKFDMAHLVLSPVHMSVRRFYYEMLKSYYRIIMRPGNIFRLIRKYGIRENFKMLKGSQRVSVQYLMKIIKG